MVRCCRRAAGVLVLGRVVGPDMSSLLVVLITALSSGVASGYPNGPMDGNQVPDGYTRGQPGSRLPADANATATWHKGALTDVAWTITANHGVRD